MKEYNIDEHQENEEKNEDKVEDLIPTISLINEENIFAFLNELNNIFEIKKLINKSNISEIYQAYNIKENRLVNLKVIEKIKLKTNYESFIQQIEREEHFLKLLESDNIIKIYTKIDTKNYIIFELEDCGIDLSTYMKEKGPLKGFYINIFQIILIGITNAMKELNKKGIMHRDIKPSNVFIQEGKSFSPIIKLGGFGSAIYVKDNISEALGSIFYTAPEIIKKMKYDEKCDIWSVGVLLYEAYFGQLPYGKNVTPEIIKHVINKEENIFFDKSNISKLDELFKNILVINQNNRVGFKELFELVDGVITEIKDIAIFIRGSSLPLSKLTRDLTIKEKIKKKETFLNIDKFECMNDKKYDLVIDEDDKIVMKINKIIKGGKLPDIMSIPNGIIDSTEISKFNNIIYYDENYDFINCVHTDSDYFEKITTGAFMLCTNLDSLKLVKAEIIKQNMSDIKILFNLIVTGSKCEKLMKFLEKNKDFDKCIRNICIYCMHPEQYQYLKNKYPKIHDDIYKKRKDVAKFINDNSSENINPFSITKLITYEEYVAKYKKRHIKISEFYGNLSKNTYQEQISDMEILINTESKNKELKQVDEKKLLNGFLTFDIKEDLENLESFPSPENMNEITINEYTKNTYYKDLNKWLLKSKDNYESIFYFTSRLMYSLNSYALKKNKFYNQNEKILYRGIKMAYSCLLPYERARGKIIILTSFTSTSESKEAALKFAKRKDAKMLYQENLFFSVLFTIKNKWIEGWISSGINIQDVSVYKQEKEILFQPFTFYYVEKVVINKSKYTADIYLEIVGKKDIFEKGLKEGKELFYDSYDNIIKYKN